MKTASATVETRRVMLWNHLYCKTHPPFSKVETSHGSYSHPHPHPHRIFSQDNTSSAELIMPQRIDIRISLLESPSQLIPYGIYNHSLVPINPTARWSKSDVKVQDVS